MSSSAPVFDSRRDYLLATLVGAVALVLYLLTVQRTLSFWDCGEFIACAAILGIPHPPGTALFVLIGRIFTLLPVPEDIGFRVNLMSVCFSALSVSLGYLIVSRITRRYLFPSESFWGREWLFFLSGACGAFLAGFGATVWTNAIEAEVYGLTLFMFFLIVYVNLLWLDARGTRLGFRLLVFAVFVAVLGLGVHLMVYLAIPALWLTVFAAEPDLRRDWRIWLAAAITMAITVAGVKVFIWNIVFVLALSGWFLLAPADLTRRLRAWIVPLLVPLCYGLFAVTLPLRRDVDPGLIKSQGSMGSFFETFYWSTTDWFVALLVLAVCMAGVWRSAHDPAIDENSPETWTAFQGFLERKQYGRESMVTRMFRRRGDLAHQLGRHPRMGFWSFFEKQYGLKSGPVDVASPQLGGMPPSFLLLFGLGLFGAGFVAVRKKVVGVPILLTLLLVTVGLVLYMNFADGTRYDPRSSDQAYLEVRDRDYFFTTGFALFGLCIGLGVAAFLRAFLEPGSKLWKPVLVASSIVFLFALPYKTVQANYWSHDRSRDFIPYDYAYNLLNSCEPDAVLFTNGDNDTFPLWCLQEAYGIRKDVRIINLSLANTHWYIQQIKSHLKVPFDIPDEQIELLRPHAQLGRVQDQVVNIVLESNAWQYPIYFGSSSPASSRVYRGKSLDSNLVMEGMVMKLHRDRGLSDVDRSRILRRYREEYRFRGVTDSTIYLNEATRRIADNYATGLMFVADGYRRAGILDSAFQAAAFASQLRPALDQPRLYMVQMAGEFGRPEVVDSIAAAAPVWRRGDLYYNFGVASELSEQEIAAAAAYKEALSWSPQHVQSFQRCAALHFKFQLWDTLLGVIDRWIEANPQDTLGPLMRREALTFREQAEKAPATP
jgi:hypothetical protein